MVNLVALGWIISSIFFSTVLISLNKYVTRTFNFDYMTTLTAFHFIVTYTLLEIMCRMGLFERAPQYPVSARWKLAAFGVASVVFMNFNLARNSVGFYQLSKLCCIPAIVVYNFIAKQTKTPLNILISLSILLTGVGLYSVNDVELNLWGTIIASIAVASTACFQIGAGSDQKEFSMSGPQLQHATAFPQFVLCLLTAIVTEFINPSHSILQHQFSQIELIFIVMTALFAVGVNVSCFGIIGKTSALTYQVVGHVKTILILLSGFILFPPTKGQSTSQLVKTAAGMVISMVGIIMYTAFGLRNKANNEEAEKANNEPPALQKKEGLSGKTIENNKEEKPLPGNLFPPMDATPEIDPEAEKKKKEEEEDENKNQENKSIENFVQNQQENQNLENPENQNQNAELDDDLIKV